ncbi:MAG: Fic/DOC family protein [Parahaliea sp.]
MTVSTSDKWLDVFEDKLIKPGRTPEDLENRSRLLSEQRALELKDDPIGGKFDLEHMTSIHRYTFQDVSSHAGVVREYDLSKGGTYFAQAVHIDYLMHKELTAHLEALGKEADSPPEFTKRMAEIHSTIDYAHPFREGNGRTTRTMMDQIAKTHGYELDFKATSREQWVEASIEAIHGDDSKKQALFKDIVTPGPERQQAAVIQALKVSAKDSSKEAQETVVKILSEHKVSADLVKEIGNELVNKAPSRPDPSDGWER